MRKKGCMWSPAAAIILFVLWFLHARGEEQQPAEPHVRLLSYLDHFDELSCFSLRSLMVTGISNFTYLGLKDDVLPGYDAYFGQNSKNNNKQLVANSQETHHMKIFVVHAYLEALLKHEPSSEHDVVVFNDGSDSLYTRFTFKQVISRYKLLEEQAAKAQQVASSAPPTATTDSLGVVFFSGERQCWPFCLKTSNISSSFRYVNSGQWAGRVKDAANLFRLWTYVLRLQTKNGCDRDWCGDQKVLHEIQLGSYFNAKENRSVSLAINSTVQEQVKALYPFYKPVNIDVDHRCYLFQSAFRTSIYSKTGERRQRIRQRRRLATQVGQQQSHPHQKPHTDHSHSRNSPFYFFQNESTFGPYFSHKDGKLYNTETQTSPLISHHPGKRERKQISFFDMEHVLFDRRIKNSFFKTCLHYMRVYPSVRAQCGHLINCKE